MMKRASKILPILGLLLVAAGCGGSAPPISHASGLLKIKHVVWLMQENRSFDDLFQGYPGADTSPTGKDRQGNTITLQPVSLAAGYDLDHSSTAFFKDCHGTGRIPGTDCRMDGFDQEYCYQPCPLHPQYAYVPHAQTRIYFAMAHQYVLADRTFTSNIDLSYVSHQYMIAGQAHHAVDFPSRSWGCNRERANVIGTLTEERSYECVHSDHAACGSASGPRWVASVVNAIGESRFWDSTAIFVMWDDWAAGTITCRRPTWTSTVSAFACRCSLSHPMQKAATFHTCSTNMAAS